MLGGKFNLGSLMKNAKKIQEMMQKTQEELAKIRVHGEAGAGLVKITMSAQHEVIHIELADELLKEPKEVLEDLVKAAFNDASQKVTKITQEKMMSAGSLFNMPTEDDTQ
jgi:DNA-binding YbaB/EbfC family protein